MCETGIPYFGPCKQAAMIESNKEFAKQFMTRFKLPTAKWQSFTDADEACHFIRRLIVTCLWIIYLCLMPSFWFVSRFVLVLCQLAVLNNNQNNSGCR